MLSACANSGCTSAVVLSVANCCHAPAPKVSPSKVQAALSKFDLANDVRMNAKVSLVCFGRFGWVTWFHHNILSMLRFMNTKHLRTPLRVS